MRASNAILLTKSDICALIFVMGKGSVQLKILVVLTTKARPPPPGKALIVQNHRKKITQLLSSWSDPG